MIFLSRTAPLKLGYAFSLGEHLPEKSAHFSSDALHAAAAGLCCLPVRVCSAALQRDIPRLSHPYESMEPFLQMIREAANDWLYWRSASRFTGWQTRQSWSNTCAAAENGKDVTALIELRARFDEQNNIDWSERMEEAGCKIIYGL